MVGCGPPPTEPPPATQAPPPVTAPPAPGPTSPAPWVTPRHRRPARRRTRAKPRATARTAVSRLRPTADAKDGKDSKDAAKDGATTTTGKAGTKTSERRDQSDTVGGGGRGQRRRERRRLPRGRDRGARGRRRRRCGRPPAPSPTPRPRARLTASGTVRRWRRAHGRSGRATARATTPATSTPRFTRAGADRRRDRQPVHRRRLDLLSATPATCARSPDNSVALVVTSPPYFAGKAYETDLEAGHIPSTYLEYLAMLRDVFAECLRVLEPGGRMCVNVANLGRKPYRSLAGDVTTILQDELAMLLRGEVMWVKAKGAAGSCAFGSYMKASNPGAARPHRAGRDRVEGPVRPRTPISRPARKLGLPHESDISKEEFLASTLDVWEIRPERARRVNHPAPFPVELPERFIHLYTYVGDVVLDPFLGSGSTAVAAAAHRTALRGLRPRPRVRGDRRSTHRRSAAPRPSPTDGRRPGRPYHPTVLGSGSVAVSVSSNLYVLRRVRRGRDLVRVAVRAADRARLPQPRHRAVGGGDPRAAAPLPQAHRGEHRLVRRSGSRSCSCCSASSPRPRAARCSATRRRSPASRVVWCC